VDTIILASPRKHGDAVRKAQGRLNGNNFLKRDFGISEIDGIFGEETARACKRAKYWLGYPAKEIRGIYGGMLDGYLSGAKKLPPSYKKRRNERVASYGKTPIREKALKRAQTQIGYKENPPGSNKNKFGLWYGFNGVPWCAEFVTWCYIQEGHKGFDRGSRWAYVPWVVQAARRGEYGLAITNHPQPGDLVCFDWDNDNVADHIGLFEKDLPGDRFQTVEGNTAIGNDSNGGEVMRRERRVSQVQAFVHVGG